MECLGGYTFIFMTFVILSGGLKMRDEHGMLRGVYISRPVSVILLGGVKIRDEHTMLRGVYISRHVFCHPFNWFENRGRAWNA